MGKCQGSTLKGQDCHRKTNPNEIYCWQHLTSPGLSDLSNLLRGPKISKHRIVGDLNLFHDPSPEAWESEYNRIIDPKYQKLSRNFRNNLLGLPWTESEPPIYLIPRVRGGKSYKSFPLAGVNSDQIMYCTTSKGFPMQDVCEFTLGPIVNSGLCLINSAYSKCIMVDHIKGGKVDLKRSNFWKPYKHPERSVEYIDPKYMMVDGIKVESQTWLQENLELWFPKWDLWRKNVALSSTGDIDWITSDVVSFWSEDHYLTFIECKKSCWIQPCYELLINNNLVMNFIWSAWKDHSRPIGLVHPKVELSDEIKPITREQIREIYDSPTKMCYQPHMIAGLLLGVPA